MTKFWLYHLALLIMLTFFLYSQTEAQIQSLNFETESKKPKISLPQKQTSPIGKKESEIKVSEEDLIHFGDLIELDILGSTEYDWRGTITPEGFLDGVRFAEKEIYGLCRTGTQVADDVAKSYKKILKNPKVQITILDRSSRPISTLFGAVGLPQRFKLKREVRLNELIVLSGGFTEKASGTIQILRQADTSCLTKLNNKRKAAESKKSPNQDFIKISQEKGPKFISIKISDLLSGKKEANPLILYGDIVTVMTAEPIYVIGGVLKPGTISSREKLTVSRAVASAGGLTRAANPQKILVFRRQNGRTKIIKIDLKEIEADKAEDIILKPYDIIDVAENGRQEKKYSPIINFEDNEGKKSANLPLRVID